MSDELLPCPFCGDEPELHWINEAGEVLTAWVSCKCGCEHHERLTKEVAVKKWNSRHLPNDAQGVPLAWAILYQTGGTGIWKIVQDQASADFWEKEGFPVQPLYALSSAGNAAQAALDGVGTADDILRLANVVDEARLAYLDAYMLGLEDMDAKEEALRQVLWDDKGTWGPALRELARRLRSPDVAATPVNSAFKNLLDAAKLMPRATPAPGASSTVHNFPIEAAYVWALARACKNAEAALALPSAMRERGNRFCKHDDCAYPDCLVEGGICPSQPSAMREGK